MNAKEIYKRVLQKVNLNDTNSNVHVPKSTFVLVFREEAELWLKNAIEKKNSSDRINEIEEFLVLDTELKRDKDYKDSSDFNLPTNYFDYSSSYSLATKGECKNRVIVNWDIKNKNINTILTNSNESPSFEYQETPVKIANNKLKVYREDFKIDKVYLDYYKIPIQIDIEGYRNFDGTPSKNVNADFSDIIVNQIISRVALALTRNSQNAEGFQFAKERVEEVK